MQYLHQSVGGYNTVATYYYPMASSVGSFLQGSGNTLQNTAQGSLLQNGANPQQQQQSSNPTVYGAEPQAPYDPYASSSAIQNANYQEYLNAVNLFNQQNPLIDQQRQYDLQQSQGVAGTQKDRINQDLGNAQNYAGQDYNTAKSAQDLAYQRNQEDLQRNQLQNQGNLKTSYSARGIGDSSAAETAVSQSQQLGDMYQGRSTQDYQNAQANAKQLFDRNISTLNTSAQRQMSDIDSYLSNLQQKYNYQTQNIDVERMAQDKNYQLEAQKILATLGQINDARQQFQSAVNQQAQSAQNFDPNLLSVVQAQNNQYGTDYGSQFSGALNQNMYTNPNFGNAQQGNPYQSLSGTYLNGTYGKNDPLQVKQ